MLPLGFVALALTGAIPAFLGAMAVLGVGAAFLGSGWLDRHAPKGAGAACPGGGKRKQANEPRGTKLVPPH